MTDNQNRLEDLLEKFSRNEVSKREFDELCELISVSKNDFAIKAQLLNDLKETKFTRLDKKSLILFWVKSYLLKPHRFMKYDP